MKEIFMNVIRRGGYDLTGLLANIDKYHVEGKLPDKERDELYAAARGNADPNASADFMAMIARLDERITALEKGGVIPPADVEEYVTGKFYYTGDKCRFGGKTYVCIAPQGTVCVWSPADYPAYWEVV